MKLFFALLIGLGSVSVFAGDFEVVKDGETYSCALKVNADPNAVIACTQKAMDYYGLYLPKADALAFCKGAQDNHPVDCAIKAMDYYGLYLPKADAVKFCRGAKDNSRVDCAIKAMDYYGLHLSKDEAIKMCSDDGLHSVNGVEFVRKVDFLNKLQVFKNRFNLF